jgi:L-seryl-tRNA(Ser) seleniumtransferase
VLRVLNTTGTIGFVEENERLRRLPAVQEVLEGLAAPVLERFPHNLLVAEVRRVLEEMRGRILRGETVDESPAARVEASVLALEKPSLRGVINATGVVLHTNLGRAPLGDVRLFGGYSNLEYDLATGRRGKRDVHASGLLERLVGAPGIAVNNNAAAVFLALHELAAGGEVVVSRGELIEIGDGFRIPDIMARSGAVVREVGTTNRTHLEDYRAAITERTRLVLRVHPSNFRMEGFTSRPALGELAALSRERGLPLYEDLGSGCVVDLRPFGIHEPLVSDSLKAGADVVSFSGDKLLGGPQAGILAGRAELVARLRRNPLFRALRLDKAIYQAYETTLRNLVLERWDLIPALAMIRQSAPRICERAEALLQRHPGIRAKVIAGQSVIGGGATPEQAIPTWLIALEGPAVALERRLRCGEPPVIGRIEEDRLVLDLRTVAPGEEAALAQRLESLA